MSDENLLEKTIDEKARLYCLIEWGAAGDVDLAIMVALPCSVFILGGTKTHWH